MKIAFTGSHGVGKTTLMTIVAKNHPEYEVQLESLTRKTVNDPSKLNLTTPEESEKLIAEAYMNYFLERKDKNFISSRHMIDVLAYSMYLEKKNGNISDETMEGIEDKIEEIKKLKLFDLVMYVPIEFEQQESGKFREGQKENPDYQRDIDTIIKFLLWGYNIPYVTISGTKEERIVKIESYLGKGKA